MTSIKTERLILRPWRRCDLEPFAKLNSDPKVMEHFPSLLSKEESDKLAKKLQANIEEKGWGLWAVEVPGVADFIGFIGLNEATFSALFTPAVEVGWRLAFEHWGKGYATEGAMAALKYAFEELGLREIVSFTVVKNIRSTSVMKRIGMTRDPKEDFDHPNVPRESPIRRHVLYRLKNENSSHGKREVEVVPYDSSWPEIFEKEATLIKQALEPNCLDVHHIGSTAVPGLNAKPTIDFLPVVKNILDVDKATQAMEKLGYDSMGEYGIPFRRFFKKGTSVVTRNVHVFEEGNPEIDRHLKFRDWMRTHPKDREAYAELKEELAKTFPSDVNSYSMGKDEFIGKIDAKAGFDGCRMVCALTDGQWAAVRSLRQKYFFKSKPDPFTWTFDHKDHIHLVFYKGAKIIGYTHLQLWHDKRAALRIIVIEESYRNHGFGSEFLELCELWLTHQGFKNLHIQSDPESLKFYSEQGYTKMPFNDPDGYKPDPIDIEIGKEL